MKRWILAAAALLLLFGCSAKSPAPTPSEPQELPAQEQPDYDAADPPTSSQDLSAPSARSYLDRLVEGTASELATPGMTEFEKAKAAFDYMIENTVFDEPIGLELWRVRADGEEAPTFVEQRALSPLRFGVGMCEDYAAALALLLQGLGLEAEYVPGLTYSLQGNLVDHAWTMVKVDGVWYHLDSQLEDNVSRNGAIRYRYFMKSDASMARSHVWGQSLIGSGLLTPEQNAEIEENFLAPSCPQDYPTPPEHVLAEAPAPNLPALKQRVREELAAYESEHGALPPMEPSAPPLFGLAGFGPEDEG